jgi:lipopolysaccharide biosynthesis glycosyltransferase
VAVALDQNLRAYLPPLLESLFEKATGPVRHWVLGRGLDADYQQWITRAWPEAAMTFFDFGSTDYGPLIRNVPHITMATMDRLILPELLHEVERVTYVDMDTVVEGDVCELASIDLRGRPLAARTSEFSMANEWRRIGDLLPAQAASDLRRSMSTRHAFDYTNFNAGVLVLDLARMRADGFVAVHLPLVARFGLNDQDLLNAYVGPDRVELDRRWNALPMFEDVTEPGIIHFAGALKPWGDQLVAYQDRWQRYADRVAARVGTPPPP